MKNKSAIKSWEDVQLLVKNKFGEKIDEQTILYIIGLQELGKNNTTYKKEEKLDIIHIGICTVLSKQGYYEFIGKDDEGWPHFKNIKKIKNEFKDENQTILIRKAIISYFEEINNHTISQ